MSCAAYGCKNRHTWKKPGITFHKFPKDPERRAKWVRATRRVNFTPSSSSLLCSEHFTEDSIDRTSLCCVRIREDAVPSIFKGIPSCNNKVKNLRKPPTGMKKLPIPRTPTQISIEKNAVEPKKPNVNCNSTTTLENKQPTQTAKKYILPKQTKCNNAEQISCKPVSVTSDKKGLIQNAVNNTLATEADFVTVLIQVPVLLRIPVSGLNCPTNSTAPTPETVLPVAIEKAIGNQQAHRKIMPTITLQSAKRSATDPSKIIKLKASFYQSQRKYSCARKRLKVAWQMHHRLKTRNRKLFSTLTELKRQVRSSSEGALPDLESIPIPDLNPEFQRYHLAKDRPQHDPKMRNFALTLRSYSSTAYDLARKTFGTCLPHPRTLAKWVSDDRHKPTDEILDSKVCKEIIADEVPSKM